MPDPVENSGARPDSSRPGDPSSCPQEALSPNEAESEARLAAFENLPPEHRQLLSLLSAEEQKPFAADVEPGSVESLAALAQILTRERTRLGSNEAARIVLATLLAIGAFVVTPILWLETFPAATALSIFMALPILGLLAYANPPRRLERAAFEHLLQIANTRSVGLLLEQRQIGSAQDRTRVQATLIRLLPQVGPEDAAELKPSQWQLLYGILEYHRRDRDIELRLAVIATLDRIGNRRSLEPLYALAAGEAAGNGERAVRTAAQKCLYALQAQIDFGQPETIPEYLDRIFSFSNSQNSPLYVDSDSLYALLALLPHLTAANYTQILSPVYREHLCTLFSPAIVGSYGYDKLRLYREIVRTLERVGDTKAIHSLQGLATMDVPFDGAKQLQSAAREALRTLRAQVEKEKVSKTLLRASLAPDVHPDELLRAVVPAESETEPKELLRASMTPQTEPPPRPTVKTDPLAEMRKMVLSLPPEDPDR